MGLFVFWRPWSQSSANRWSFPEVILAGSRKTWWTASLAGIAAFAFLCHFAVGGKFVNRPLKEGAVKLSEDVRIDPTLPSLNEYLLQYWKWTQTKEGTPPESLEGRRIRVKLITSNNMFPPKYAGRVPWVPEFASNPGSETYYMGDMFPELSQGGRVGITYFGARLNAIVREGDYVDVEGTLILSQPGKWPDFWVKAHKVKLDSLAASTIPVAHK